jgi:hypothetical protein
VEVEVEVEVDVVEPEAFQQNFDNVIHVRKVMVILMGHGIKSPFLKEYLYNFSKILLIYHCSFLLM